MDKKKIQNARIVATNIIMACSVIAIVFVLTLIAMGFTFNESGNLEQSGLIQISSHPSSATVEIDNEQQFSRTEINKMLSSGYHDIEISKSGFDTWQTTIDVDAGLLTNIEWVRLFPITPKITQATTYDNIASVSISPDHKSLVAITEKTGDLYVFDLQNANAAKNSKIALSKIIKITTNKTAEAENSETEEIQTITGLSIIAWSSNNKIILKHETTDFKNWYIIDLNDSTKSVSLSDMFSFKFDKILIANDSATKLWAISEKALYSIDTSSKSISAAIDTNIIDVSNNQDTVAYIQKNVDDSQREYYTIKTYTEGEKSSSLIATFSEDSATGPEDEKTNIIMGTYWGEEWIAYNVNRKAEILKGRYPSADKREYNTLKSILNNDLDYIPVTLQQNSTNRIIVFKKATHQDVFDIENNRSYAYLTDSSDDTIEWLDNYILVEHYNEKIVVRDFTGENRREIITGIDNNFPVAISNNNKYLYYFTLADQNSTPKIELSDLETKTQEEKTKHYDLQKMDLSL